MCLVYSNRFQREALCDVYRTGLFTMTKHKGVCSHLAFLCTRHSQNTHLLAPICVKEFLGIAPEAILCNAYICCYGYKSLWSVRILGQLPGWYF